jgi:hypothetical protein
VSGAIASQYWPEGVEALRTSSVQLQHGPIPQPPQDLTRGKGIEAYQLPQAGVVHLGVAEGFQSVVTAGLREQVAVEIAELQGGRAAFVAFHQPLKLEGLDLALAAVHGLIAHAQREAVACQLDRAIGAEYV